MKKKQMQFKREMKAAETTEKERLFLAENEFKEKQLQVEKELKERKIQISEKKQKLLEFAEKDKIRLEERYQKETEKIKLKFKTQLALNLQLAEKKKRNALLQAELLNAQQLMTHARELTHSGGSEELPIPLLVDVSDSPKDVTNAVIPHTPSRRECSLFDEPFTTTTTSSDTSMAGRTPPSFTGERLCQDNVVLNSCCQQVTIPSASLPTQSINYTRTHTDNLSSACQSDVLWPTVTGLPHSGAQTLTDEYLQ